MVSVENFILGKWIKGDGDGQLLYNAYTGDQIGKATTKGLDMAAVLDYARKERQPGTSQNEFPGTGPDVAGPSIVSS